MRKRFDDDDNDNERPGWLWRFIRGVVLAAVVCAGVVAALSIYVLAPPAPPPPAPEPVAADTGPEIVSGIEVSTRPAYSVPAEPTASAPEPEPETSGLTELSGSAFSVNAVPFDAAPGTPLVAVILDDTASNPALHAMLFSIDMPLTVGVVAGGGGDRVTADAARKAGFEVVAQLPLTGPGQSGGGGLEYGLSEDEAADRTLTLIQRLPMAVAASRLLAVAPPEATVLRGMFSVLAPLGFAYVDHGVAPDGSSTALAAGVDGIIGVSHFSIPPGAGAAQAHAVLDRAAADAVRRGGSVVIAAPGENLILALQLWVGQGTGGVARLAPLSAVIKRQLGG